MASRAIKPRSLLTGRASHIPMGERSIREQVEEYLSRMRYTLPLPVEARTIYFSCLPDKVEEWWLAGKFADMEPSREHNLLLAMHQTPSQTSKHRHILHISAESRDDYYAAVQGTRGHEKLFWITIDPCWPAPRNSSESPFWLPTDHPAYADILKWVDAAYTADDEIDESLKIMETFRQAVQTTSVAAKVWPELANFLSFKKGAPNNVSALVRERAMKACLQSDRERIIYQLSRAVMLPEKYGPLPAWVKFYPGNFI